MVLLFRSLGPFTARVRRRGAVVNVILPQYNRLARRDYHVLDRVHQSSYLKESLPTADKEIHDLIQQETERQNETIDLNPCSNYAGRSILECTGSEIQMLNSEGRIGQRYYPCNDHIDTMESMCHDRARAAFDLDPAVWSVNVQSLNRHLACFQVCSGLLQPKERLLALELRRGSSLTSQFTTISLAERRDRGNLTSESSVLRYLLDTFRPRVLLSNTPASGRWDDVSISLRQRDADCCRGKGTFVVTDMTETCGLVSAGLLPAPFPHSDIVIAGTQGSLRGPTGTLIFTRNVKIVDSGGEKGLPELVDRSVFPGHQGGPHNHAIAAVTTALRQAATPAFRAYQEKALLNAGALADRLRHLGYRLRDVVDCESPRTHCVVARVPIGHVGDCAITTYQLVAILRRTLAAVGVEVGHLSVVDQDEIEVHLGTLAMTSRQWGEDAFREVADVLHRAVLVAQAPRRVTDYLGSQELSEWLFDR